MISKLVLVTFPLMQCTLDVMLLYILRWIAYSALDQAVKCACCKLQASGSRRLQALWYKRLQAPGSRRLQAPLRLGSSKLQDVGGSTLQIVIGSKLQGIRGLKIQDLGGSKRTYTIGAYRCLLKQLCLYQDLHCMWRWGPVSHGWENTGWCWEDCTGLYFTVSYCTVS